MNTPDKSRRAIIYTRVSTTQQTEGTSLESQYAACRLKAEQIGATVVSVLEDAGVSGGDYITREGIQSALKLIESGEADTLIIYDMSRYSRDAIHQQQILNRVLQAGGNLVFTTFDLGDLRDNPEGRLAFGVQGVFAEYERLKIRSRMMQGRKASAQKGLQVTHSAPFGYEIATRDTIMAGKYKPEDHKKYFIVEADAERVRDIYSRYSKGASLYSIARDYNAAGIPTPKKRGIWRTTSIRAILINPTYKGEAHFGKYKTHRDEGRIEKGFRSKVTYSTVPESERIVIAVPPIVTPQVWQACQVRLKENQMRLGGRTDRRYLLTSILRCGMCGRKMHGRAIGKNEKYAGVQPMEPLYHCQGISHYHSEKARCKSSSYRGSRLEKLVLDKVIRFMADPQLLADALQKQEAARRPAPAKQTGVTELRKALRQLEKRESATVQAQIRALQAGISSKIYESELKTITAERAAVEAQLREIARTKEAPKAARAQAQKMAALFVDYLNQLSSPETSVPDKRDLLMEVIESVTPRRNGRSVDVEIQWRTSGEKPGGW